jgi:tetratricopeptide (TPR) repeat protein
MSTSVSGLGVLLARAGRGDEAVAAYGRARDLYRALAEAQPDFAGHRHGLASSLAGLGAALAQLGRTDEAVVAYEQARDLQQGLAEAHPDVAEYQDTLAWSLSALGDLLDGAGRTNQAVTSLRRAIAVRGRIEALSSEARFDLARNHATLAAVASRGASGPTSAEARAEAEAAVTALRGAIAAGFGDAARIRAEPEFAPLWARPDFRALLLDLAFPDEPFAG